MEIITSNKGQPKIVHEGFIFVKQKDLAKGVVSYECEKRRRALCKAKVKVKDGIVVGTLNEHSHAVEVGRAEALSVRQGMKRRAEETEETPQQIITQSVTLLSDTAATQIPATRTIRRVIRRQRQQAGLPLPVPLSRAAMIIPVIYQMSHRGDRFLQFDSGEGDDGRMLIFSTDRNLQVLREAQHWFMDGTFKVVPEIFYQLYTIHVLAADRVIPCVYALLPNKQAETYRSLFRELLDLDPMQQPHPQSVLMDYERGAFNMFRANFPGVHVQGCFYHLAQCVYRKVQEYGLQADYHTDEELSIRVRMVPAIAFVPIVDVIDTYETLVEEFDGDDRLTRLLDYFEDNYIGRPIRRGGRRAPLFPIDMWNVHGRVAEGLPRTNNAAEGWHRRFQSDVGAHHPNVWKFLNVLKREQALTEIDITQMIAGFPPNPQRRQYMNSAARIATIVEDFDNRHVLNFLRGIALNLQF